jgi:hypothetical protein
MACRSDPGARDPALFSPQAIVAIKALACELPTELGLPFSRLSVAEVARQVILRGIVIAISVATVWRYLHEDAIRPWMDRSWPFPREPLFAEKAARVLGLYFRVFQGISLWKSRDVHLFLALFMPSIGLALSVKIGGRNTVLSSGAFGGLSGGRFPESLRFGSQPF